MDMTPCLTDDQVVRRIVEEQQAWRTRQHDYKVKELISYASETTGECHIFPVFETDKVEDLCNRYSDLFPEECKLALKQIQDTRGSLYNETGMSKEKLNLIKLKLPIILYRAIDILIEGFWNDKKSLNWFLSNFEKFKLGISNVKNT